MLTPLLLSFGVLIGPPPERQPAPPSPAVPVTFRLRISGGRTRFHTGEVVPIELEFTSSIAKRFVLDSATYDRSGRLTIDEFRVEPIDRVGDPLLDYFASAGGFIGGGLRGMPVLSETPTVVKLELNEWFRFDQPGTFRLSARSHRITDDAAPAGRGALVVESNTVTFDIVPPDPDWVAATLSSARQVLDPTRLDGGQREACRVLRFLATDAAVDEMIARFDDGRWGCQFEYTVGLFTAPDRARVVRGMEAALGRRDQAVSASFLHTLALLAVYASHPEYRPAQTAENKGRFPEPGEIVRHRELVEAEIARYRAVVRGSLPDKTGPARVLTLADEFQASRDPSDELRHQLTIGFLDLPPDRQRLLLEYPWSRLANPEMLPVLRTLVANGAAVNEPCRDVALLRLYQLAPDEGRAQILREIATPSRGVTLKTLGSLPDRELRDLDDRLASNVAASSGFEDYSIRAELLQRYASAAVAPRVLASVRDRLDGLACQPKAALLAYFLRVDPTLGAELLNAALAVRRRTGCYTSVLVDVAKLQMSPVLEATAIAHLDDPAPAVVANAAEMLGGYGSPVSRLPLGRAFERWHAAWAGRAEDVRPRRTQPPSQAEQSMVEYRLSEALGTGRGWVAGRRDVEALRDWCVTDSCLSRVQSLLAQVDSGRIDVSVRDGDEAFISIAQYQLEAIPALEAKLAQYPVGTAFRLTVTAPSPQIAASVEERIRRVARARGIQIEPR